MIVSATAMRKFPSAVVKRRLPQGNFNGVATTESSPKPKGCASAHASTARPSCASAGLPVVSTSFGGGDSACEGPRQSAPFSYSAPATSGLGGTGVPDLLWREGGEIEMSGAEMPSGPPMKHPSAIRTSA